MALPPVKAKTKEEAVLWQSPFKGTTGRTMSDVMGEHVSTNPEVTERVKKAQMLQEIEQFNANNKVPLPTLKEVFDVKNIANYWQQDNKEFDATNPTLSDRFMRSFNPITAVGDNIGDFKQAYDDGDKAGMVIAALMSAPALPIFKPAVKLAKAKNKLKKTKQRTLDNDRMSAAYFSDSAIDAAINKIREE